MESRLLPNYKIVGSEEISYPTYSKLSAFMIERETNYISSIVDVLIKKVPQNKPIKFLVRGMSMAILTGSVVYHLRCKGRACAIDILRKEGDDSHMGVHFKDDESYTVDPSYIYVVVDDLVASGDTVQKLGSLVKFNYRKRKLDFLFVSSIYCRGESEVKYWSKYYKYVYSNRIIETK